ncbi:MAG: hypothetical protein ACYC0Q_15190, partial [Eubacteriales bacterium]
GFFRCFGITLRFSFRFDESHVVSSIPLFSFQRPLPFFGTAFDGGTFVILSFFRRPVKNHFLTHWLFFSRRERYLVTSAAARSRVTFCQFRAL